MSIFVQLVQQAQFDAECGDVYAQDFIAILKRTADDLVKAFKSVDVYMVEWDYFEQFMGDVE